MSIASSKVCMRHAVRVAIFMQVHPLLSCPSSWLTTLSVVCLSAGSESREVSKRPFGKVGADAGSRMLPLLSGIRAEKAAASLPGYSLRPLHPHATASPPSSAVRTACLACQGSQNMQQGVPFECCDLSACALQAAQLALAVALH